MNLFVLFTAVVHQFASDCDENSLPDAFVHQFHFHSAAIQQDLTDIDTEASKFRIIASLVGIHRLKIDNCSVILQWVHLGLVPLGGNAVLNGGRPPNVRRGSKLDIAENIGNIVLSKLLLLDLEALPTHDSDLDLLLPLSLGSSVTVSSSPYTSGYRFLLVQFGRLVESVHGYLECEGGTTNFSGCFDHIFLCGQNFLVRNGEGSEKGLLGPRVGTH